jgi:hypothetical protein
LIIEVLVEDDLKQIVDSPGAMQAITTAVHKCILDLKTAYWDKQSRAPAANSYQGTVK